MTNDTFAENAWYFRNALVRANYTNWQENIHGTTEYLELFLRNLLLKEHNLLKNRALHISVTSNSKQKVDIQAKKVDIQEFFTPKTAAHILTLYEVFPGQTIFCRTDVMKALGIGASRSSALLKELKAVGFIEGVLGHGKGKYRFCTPRRNLKGSIT